MKRALGVLIVLALIAAASCSALQFGRSEKREAMIAALRQVLRSTSRPPYVTSDREGSRLWKLTREFYEKRSHAPAWIEDAKPRRQMTELVAALRNAEEHGLDPELYNVTLLEARLAEASKGFLSKKGFDPKEAGAMDAWLTYLYMKYSSDLADGISDLAHADPAWKIKPERYNPLEHLETALEQNRVAASVSELASDEPQYHALKKTLAEYREQAKRGGWPRLPESLRLKPGQRSPHVVLLAKRLAASGDYTARIRGEAGEYGPQLQEAVRRFQRRHGLADNGIVNTAVIAALNVPIEERMREIALNMERWRWLPRDLGDRYILVNIPEYRLEVWEHDRVPLTMRVVVGKADTPTPIFSDTMTHVVFSPYWNVPPDIAQGETLPAVLQDPEFLARQNMEVLDKDGRVLDLNEVDLSDPTAYRFRQRPGGGNALGYVKFMFPNQYNVYLHDTPTDSLFARASRSFSHGCVRVEQPEALARYVLSDQPEWTPERIREAMHAGEERHVKLTRPVPVYLGYWTARVSADGLVQFRDDIYDIDGRQSTTLAERMARLRRSSAAATLAVTPSKPKSGARPATQ